MSQLCRMVKKESKPLQIPGDLQGETSVMSTGGNWGHALYCLAVYSVGNVFNSPCVNAFPPWPAAP